MALYVLKSLRPTWGAPSDVSRDSSNAVGSSEAKSHRTSSQKRSTTALASGPNEGHGGQSSGEERFGNALRIAAGSGVDITEESQAPTPSFGEQLEIERHERSGETAMASRERREREDARTGEGSTKFGALFDSLGGKSQWKYNLTSIRALSNLTGRPSRSAELAAGKEASSLETQRSTHDDPSTSRTPLENERVLRDRYESALALSGPMATPNSSSSQPAVLSMGELMEDIKSELQSGLQLAPLLVPGPSASEPCLATTSLEPSTSHLSTSHELQSQEGSTSDKPSVDQVPNQPGPDSLSNTHPHLYAVDGRSLKPFVSPSKFADQLLLSAHQVSEPSAASMSNRALHEGLDGPRTQVTSVIAEGSSSNVGRRVEFRDEVQAPGQVNRPEERAGCNEKSEEASIKSIRKVLENAKGGDKLNKEISYSEFVLEDLRMDIAVQLAIAQRKAEISEWDTPKQFYEGQSTAGANSERMSDFAAASSGRNNKRLYHADSFSPVHLPQRPNMVDGLEDSRGVGGTDENTTTQIEPSVSTSSSRFEGGGETRNRHRHRRGLLPSLKWKSGGGQSSRSKYQHLGTTGDIKTPSSRSMTAAMSHVVDRFIRRPRRSDLLTEDRDSGKDSRRAGGVVSSASFSVRPRRGTDDTHFASHSSNARSRRHSGQGNSMRSGAYNAAQFQDSNNCRAALTGSKSSSSLETRSGLGVTLPRGDSSRQSESMNYHTKATQTKWPSQASTEEDYRRNLASLPVLCFLGALSLGDDAGARPQLKQDGKDLTRDVIRVNGRRLEGVSGYRNIYRQLAIRLLPPELQPLYESLKESEEAGATDGSEELEQCDTALTTDEDELPKDDVMDAFSKAELQALILLHLVNRTLAGGHCFEKVLQAFGNENIALVVPNSKAAQPLDIILPLCSYSDDTQTPESRAGTLYIRGAEDAQQSGSSGGDSALPCDPSLQQVAILRSQTSYRVYPAGVCPDGSHKALQQCFAEVDAHFIAQLTVDDVLDDEIMGVVAKECGGVKEMFATQASGILSARLNAYMRRIAGSSDAAVLSNSGPDRSESPMSPGGTRSIAKSALPALAPTLAVGGDTSNGVVEYRIYLNCRLPPFLTT